MLEIQIELNAIYYYLFELIFTYFEFITILKYT